MNEDKRERREEEEGEEGEEEEGEKVKKERKAESLTKKICGSPEVNLRICARIKFLTIRATISVITKDRTSKFSIKLTKMDMCRILMP